MILRRSALLVIAALVASSARATDLDVEVHGADGTPVRDAVVTIHAVSGATPAPRIAPGGYAIDQQNIQFHPFVTIVPQGAQVRFLNHDPLRHHVYSFSTAKRFELKLEKQQQDRSVTFDKAGIVPLGCNIHDSMIAFIDVVDTPWAVLTDARGRAVFHGLPSAPVSIDVWHPYLRAVGNHMSRTVPLGASGRHEGFAVTLRAPPRPPTQSDY